MRIGISRKFVVAAWRKKGFIMSEKVQRTHAPRREGAPEFFDIVANLPYQRGIAVFRILLCAVLGASIVGAAADQTTFDPNQDGSLASKTIRVSRAGDWEVQMRLSNSAHDLQKQFAEKVLQTGAASGNGAAAEAPSLPVHLLLTVTGVYGSALRVIQEFEIYQETLKQSRKQSLKQGGAGKACFSVKQLHLNKGTYTVTLRVMEGEPELEGFESSLLVESARK